MHFDAQVVLFAQLMNTSSESKKYYLATYGCQMNVYDSNLIAGMLEKNGAIQTDSMESADYIVVNTCSIRGGAEDRAYARIAKMRYFKKRNPHLKIAVVGCMAQNHGEKIPTSLEHVDYVVGPDNYAKLEELFFQEQDEEDFSHIHTQQNHQENYPGKLAKFESKYSTHVTIMRGCNKKCSYCIVPFVRGQERSRNPLEIEEEVRLAVKAGIPEITLLGQTVNSYLFLEDNSRESFSDLLIRLNRIEGLKRLRFTSPHPRHFTQDVIDAMASCESVSPYVHLPLQSGSNKILKSMRRQYTREKYLEIVTNLRKAVPNIALSTDIITGYPGEEEQDFQDTLNMVKEIEFDSAFTFSYSPREGTESFHFPETLTEDEKLHRLQTLIDLQHPITLRKTRQLLGTTQEILLEGPSHRSEHEWVGTTNCFKKVVLPFVDHFHSGALVEAKIADCRGNTLVGSVIN